MDDKFFKSMNQHIKKQEPPTPSSHFLLKTRYALKVNDSSGTVHRFLNTGSEHFLERTVGSLNFFPVKEI